MIIILIAARRFQRMSNFESFERFQDWFMEQIETHISIILIAKCQWKIPLAKEVQLLKVPELIYGASIDWRLKLSLIPSLKNDSGDISSLQDICCMYFVINIKISINMIIRVTIVTLLYGLRWERIVLGSHFLLHHLLWLKLSSLSSRLNLTEW